jgi:FHA domain
MDDARSRAYQTLAVPNPNLPLRASQVGYIELVSSPDPRVEPMIFALEHTRVRVGRFSTAGTYATSSDVFVAVSDDATAISPMNTMFEYIDGKFHAFDTRSTHGTYVNGEQIRRRRALAPGDVIDIGGIPDDAGVLHGNARVVFLGSAAPAGRPIRRAPPRTRYTWHTPRRGVELEIDAAAGTAYATVNLGYESWRDTALATAQRVVASPQMPAGTLEGTGVRYHVGEPLTQLPDNWTVEVPRACAIVADLCDAIATQPIVLGPFDRGLVWLRPNGRPVLLGAGLSRVAYEHDARMRGVALSALHFRYSPEELAGKTTGPATDVFWAAYLLIELITCGEPYPTESFATYMDAVRHGQVHLPDDIPPIARAFDPDPAARPSIARFATLLRWDARRRQ